MKLVSVVLFLAVMCLPGVASATSALNEATTKCLFEVPNAEQLHVTLKQKRGAETLAVRNKVTKRSKNDPVVDAYYRCLDSKVGHAPRKGEVSSISGAVSGASAHKVGAAAAAETGVVGQVRSCMKQTRAPGSYGVFLDRVVPEVTPANGGTTLGAQSVNDCLQDVHDVQFAVATMAGAFEQTAAVQTAEPAAPGCPRRASVLYGGRQYCVD